MIQETQLVYKPSLTLEKFHASKKQIRLLLGPFGSGKTVGSCMELFSQALEMPACKDGIVRARYALVRNTYPELKTTTIQTWKSWFPENKFGRIAKIPPIFQHVKFENYDLEFYFIALNGDEDVRKLLSIEFTGFLFNELREIPSIVFDYAIGRLNRYPPKNMLPEGSEYFSFIIADSNVPPDEHWITERFIKKANEFEDYELFMQPTPLLETAENVYIENPDAENIENLNNGYDYYWSMKRNSSKDFFDVAVMCKFVSEFSGLPVLSEYKEQIHRANYEIMPNKAEPLYVGWDFGRTPCAVIAQGIKGQLLLLDEVICSENISLIEFINVFFMPIITSTKYAGMKIISICDPSGVRKNDTDDNFCIKELNKLGLNAKAAKTNDLTPRIETMKRLLTTLSSGAPNLLVSKTCKILHEAFKGGYKYKFIRDAAGRKVAGNEPDKGDKNPYTHPMDATQYIALELFYMPKKSVEKKRIFVNGTYIYA